jgi:hypothetical protein
MSRMGNIQQPTLNTEHPMNGQRATHFVAIQTRKGCRRAGAGSSGTGVPPVCSSQSNGLRQPETHGRDARATTLQETEMRPNDRHSPPSMLDVPFFAIGGFA